MPGRAAVRKALLAQLPTIVAQVTETIREQIPAYAALSPDQLAEVTAIASWGVDRILLLWVADQDLTAADINRFRGIGSARALDGRPLPGVLRAYRLAGRAVTDIVATTAGADLTVTDALALASLWMASIDSLSEALYEGHTHAADRITQDRERALADFLDDLLAGRQVTITALADRSRQLGITLPATPAVLVVESGVEAESTAPRDLDTRVRELLTEAGLVGNDSVLRDTRGPRAVLVGSVAEVSTLTGALSREGLRGCAVQASRPSELRRAHGLADLAVDLAPDHAYADRPALDEGDAQVLALLAGSTLADPSRATLCVFHETNRPSNSHLLAGLDAFLAHGSAAAAAHDLGLHAQTMRYRLRRLTELTGRDPRRPWDSFVLEAARRALGSAGSAAPPGRDIW